MPQFEVFFSDGAGFGIEMVQALDAAHAKDITRAQHATGRLSAARQSCSTAKTATSCLGRGLTGNEGKSTLRNFAPMAGAPLGLHLLPPLGLELSPELSCVIAAHEMPHRVWPFSPTLTLAATLGLFLEMAQ